jgi:hypothetical protein
VEEDRDLDARAEAGREAGEVLELREELLGVRALAAAAADDLQGAALDAAGGEVLLVEGLRLGLLLLQGALLGSLFLGTLSLLGPSLLVLRDLLLDDRGALEPEGAALQFGGGAACIGIGV